MHLKVTVNSLLAQDHDDFRVLIALEKSVGALAFPSRVQIVQTTIDPPELPPRKARDNEKRYELVRADKGARVLAAYRYVPIGEFVMVVDHDDFVNKRLARLCSKNKSSPGWYVDAGYVWSRGLFLLYRKTNFHRECGTSLIINSRVIETHIRDYGVDKTTKRWFGSHRYVKDDLERSSTPLAALPFPGAVYRVGYGDRSRRKPSVAGRLVRKRPPFVDIKQALRLRLLSAQLRKEFSLP